MKYTLGLTAKAHADLDAASKWWSRNRSANQAARWYNACIDALESLAVEPEKYPLSRESSRFPFEIRDMLFGIGQKRTHRAVFRVRGDMVLVLAIRHLAQADLLPDEF